MRLLGAAVLALLLAAQASAYTYEVRRIKEGCSAANSTGAKDITEEFSVACFTYANADSTVLSPPIIVHTRYATVEFDPDTADDAASHVSAARGNLYWCPDGDVTLTTIAAVQNKCNDLGGQNGQTALDGTQGADSTENSWFTIWGGVYYYYSSVACVGADICRLTVNAKPERP